MGVDKNQVTQSGVTPLYIAAQNGHWEVVQALLQAGADKNKARQSGETPLYVAAEKGYLRIVQALLKAGADKNKARRDGVTPLYVAALNGHLEVVRALLQAGADKNQAAQSGATPLYIAAKNGHLEVVQALLQAGADTNKACRDDATPLYVAALNGHLEVVRALLQAGADKNKALQDGATPLYIAALNGHLEVVQALLQANANIYLKYEQRLSPLAIAIIKKHWGIANLLIQHQALFFDDLPCESLSSEIQIPANTVTILLKLKGKKLTHDTPGFEHTITTPGELLTAIKRNEITQDVIEMLKGAWGKSITYLNKKEERIAMQVVDHIIRYTVSETDYQQQDGRKLGMPGLLSRCLNYVNFRKENDFRIKAHELLLQDDSQDEATVVAVPEAELRLKIAPY
jgi:ankyrin repeat protein